MRSSQPKGGSGAFWVGVVLGGLVGAAIGLWKAPLSGADLRRQLLQRGSAIGARAGQVVVGERIADAVAEGKAVARQRQLEVSPEP